jgi:ribose transport system substrate-binding protein
MKKITLLISILILTTLVLAACQPAATPTEAPPTEKPMEEPTEKPMEEPAEEPVEAMHPALEDGKLVIAWIPKALNNPVFEIGKVGAETKAAELTAAGPYEVEIMYTGSVASDMAEQARVMADAVTAGAEAIGVSCNDPTGCIDPINDAISQGLEVMSWDSDAPDSDRFTYLGVDNYEGGLAAGELLVKYMGEEGKVALITGVPGAFNLEERIRGFSDYVADYPGIEIVTTVACNDDINLGVQVVEETMQAYPDLDGWFFVGLWPLFSDRGSMPLWEEATLGGMINIVFDTLPLELEYMQDGYISGLVGQKYWGWGYDTVQMVYDKIVNGAEYDSFTNSGMDIVDPCNVDVMAEMWAQEDFTIELPPTCSAEEVAAAATGMEIGSENNPIKVLFVPSVDIDFMIESGELIEQGLNEATGLYYEVSVPSSYAATIEEMCASPEDTVGFIPAMGYVLANGLCGVEPGLASERYGWNVYWTQFIVPRDSDFQTLEDLEGATWAYPDATSTSGYLYPLALFDELGITVGETVEAGGHSAVVKAVYNGEADFGTTYFSAPLLPEGTWSTDMSPDVPDEVVADCAVNEDGALYCGEYRVLDARASITEEAPDVVQKVRILGLSPEIPNDTMSFGPDFPEDLRQVIIDGVTAFVGTEACDQSLCHEQFYDWTGVGSIFDENFDGIRLLMAAQGITLENIGE